MMAVQLTSEPVLLHGCPTGGSVRGTYKMKLPCTTSAVCVCVGVGGSYGIDECSLFSFNAKGEMVGYLQGIFSV